MLFMQLQNVQTNPHSPVDTGQLVLTNAKWGHTTLHPGVYANKFIAEAPELAKYGKILDIGAAFGVSTNPVLEQGVPIIANDMEDKNLRILRYVTSPHAYRHLLTTHRGDFRNLKIKPESLSAVMIGSVLHFLPGDEVDAALELIYSWLVPGGKLFIEVQTPHLSLFEGTMFTQYQTRKAEGRPYPGDFENLHILHPEWEILDHLNLMDIDVARNAMTRAKFENVDARYFARADYPEVLITYSNGTELGTRYLSDFTDGNPTVPHESVGAVGTKPGKLKIQDNEYVRRLRSQARRESQQQKRPDRNAFAPIPKNQTRSASQQANKEASSK